MTEDPKNPFVSCNTQNCHDLKYTVDLFQVHTIKPALSFNDFKKRCSYLNNITETKFNTLDAIEGVLTTNGSQATGSSIEVYIVHNGKGYLLSERFMDLYNVTRLNQFPVAYPDILSTFQFINQPSASPSAHSQ